ncbi:MAG: FUSC family protein [Proteobacteria bacterium]|nr:FUSC family protein [Pseudomonadota bacterium]
MDAEVLPAPGWGTRARLLAADLVAFDPARLGWALAARTTIGLAVPLLLAWLLDWPALVWTALGAFLLAIGDCTDDGDRLQPVRILVATALGSLAIMTGVLAGGSLVTAVAGMMAWGLVTGMMGAYGNAFATMALPVAWAYVELGLPPERHALPHALLLGGAFALGGLFLLLLTTVLRIGGTFGPVRAQTAACYREIARYLDAVPAPGAPPPEPRVRGAIAEARRLAAQARQSAVGASRVNQRALVLIEIADRLYSVIGAMRETGAPPVPGCRDALLAIARGIEGQEDRATLRRLRAGIEAAAREEAGGAPPDLLRSRMLGELGHALALAAEDEMPALAAPAAPRAARVSALLAPLRANLDRNSAVARHALRFAVVTSAAVMVFWVFPKPFGYWVPLTATVVLKPYAGMTLARAVQRALGTSAGILLGLALIPFLPSAAPQFVAVLALFFAMALVLPFNYGLAIVFLSAGIVPFEHLLRPGLGAAVGTDRLVATAIGVALALVGGHVLWPTFERRGLPALLRATTGATADYADAVLAAAAGDPGAGDPAAGDMQAGRRRAGLALSNLQAGVQRALTEIGGDAGAMTAILRASTALQRISNALNALLQTAPAIAAARPALGPFRAGFVAALAGGGTGGPSVAELRAAIPAGDAEDKVLAHALDRLASGLEMLGDAGAAMPAP